MSPSGRGPPSCDRYRPAGVVRPLEVCWLLRLIWQFWPSGPLALQISGLLGWGDFPVTGRLARLTLDLHGEEVVQNLRISGTCEVAVR